MEANAAKILKKCMSCDCKCNFDSPTGNSNQKWDNNKCLFTPSKMCNTAKKYYNLNRSTCICKNNVSSNVTSTLLINSDDTKVRY